jgi:hypothetical protein
MPGGRSPRTRCGAAQRSIPTFFIVSLHPLQNIFFQLRFSLAQYNKYVTILNKNAAAVDFWPVRGHPSSRLLTQAVRGAYPPSLQKNATGEFLGVAFINKYINLFI